MAHFISWLLLIEVFYTLCLFQSATGQAIDSDTIDFTKIPGWTSLRGCVRLCFGQCTIGCTGPDAHLGCLTNECLCRPSELFTGLQYVVDCAREGCQNLDDVQQANDSLKAYCGLKGYTKIQAPTLLPTDASATDGPGVLGGYYTYTISATTTVYTNQATRRAEAVFATLPRISAVKQMETDVRYIFGVAKYVMILLLSTFFLSSLAFGLRA